MTLKSKTSPLINLSLIHLLLFLLITTPLSANTIDNTHFTTLNEENLNKSVTRNASIIDTDSAPSFIDPYIPIFELFEQTQILGTGTYSTVYRCTDTKNNTYAIKKYALSPEMREFLLENGSSPEDFILHLGQNEFEIGLKVNHPNIVKIHNLAFKESDGQLEAYVIMDFVPGETFSSQRGYGKELQKKIIYQFLDAVDYLFTSNIIPDDLWSDNFMVSVEDEKLTLIDIGGYEFLGQNGAPFSHYYEELLYTINSMTLELDDPEFDLCMEKWKEEVFPSIDPDLPLDFHHVLLLHRWVVDLKEVLGAQ